jgi:TatD DNase family protein
MNEILWTDTHCHLDARYRTDDSGDDSGDDALDAILINARAAGVSRFVTVGCDLASSRECIDVATKYDDVWATVGVHPHEAEGGLDGILELLTSSRVVAVGEAGLDYYYDHSPREAQREAFAAQIQMAHQHDLPLVIHTRDAWDDTFDVLTAEGVPTRTIFHCFTGGPDEARRCLAIGAFLSFSGIVTFKNATDVAESARLCPADRLLVETDSPYLAPVPYRGRKNQPAYVADVGRFVADLRGVAVAELATQTSLNASAAFPGIA